MEFWARFMSELKFACPVCGQHITADSATSGTRIDCPTCFQKLVVPPPTNSGSTHLVLSAAKADRRQASVSEGDLQPIAKRSALSSLVATVLLILVICAGGVAIYSYRTEILEWFQRLKF